MYRKAIDVNTEMFQRSHGRKPKGVGQWAFVVVDGRKALETFFVPGAMSLADARVWAKAYVRKHYAMKVRTGYLSLEVAP